jgi:hypothetical protein
MIDGTSPEPPPVPPPPDGGEHEAHPDDADTERGGPNGPRGQAPESGEEPTDREVVEQLAKDYRRVIDEEGLGADFDEMLGFQRKLQAGEQLTQEEIDRQQATQDKIAQNSNTRAARDNFNQKMMELTEQRQREEEANPPEPDADGEPPVDTQPIVDLNNAIQEVANADPLDEEQIRLSNDNLVEQYKKATDYDYVKKLQKKSPWWYKVLMASAVIVYGCVGAQLAMANGVIGVSKPSK